MWGKRKGGVSFCFYRPKRECFVPPVFDIGSGRPEERVAIAMLRVAIEIKKKPIINNNNNSKKEKKKKKKKKKRSNNS